MTDTQLDIFLRALIVIYALSVITLLIVSIVSIICWIKDKLK